MHHRLQVYLFAILTLALGNRVVAEINSSIILVRPKAWERSVDEWVRYREQEYQVIQIDSTASANALRRSVINASEQSRWPVVAVLLCGDIGIEDDPKSKTPKLLPITPTFVIPTKVKLGPFTTPTMSTDLYFGDLDGDECPELAVGRLPAKNADDLTRMLRRSIDYERSQSFGPWRDRIHATAGVGGFGVLADTAIESVARRLLSDGIPDRFQLHMTYASLTSPYCPDPFSLTRSFIDKINGGGLFWVYMGHGNVDRLDDFVVGNEVIPICTNEQVSQFEIQDGPPIAVLLACFTGAFDARIDCFAETLLASKNGPVAVIAGSRVTMPYGMSQLSTELMDGCFRDQIPTLGGILLNAKRNVWNKSGAVIDSSNAPSTNTSPPADRQRTNQQLLFEQMARALSPEGHDLMEERREHVRLMNLLGDPLLRIMHPKTISIDCDAETAAGSTLIVSGNSPHPGGLKAELVLTRDRLPEGVRSISNFQGTDAQRASMQENYSRASELVLAKQEKETPRGDFSVELTVPPDCRGKCIVRVFVYGQDAWATGTKRVNVRRPSK